MKKIKILNVVLSLLCVSLFYGCSDSLEEEVYSQLAPQNFLNSQEGIKSVLNAAYAEGYINGYSHHSVRNIEEWCTDIEWQTGGGENRTAVLMIGFTWDPTIEWINGDMWQKPYRAIRNANIVLENLDAAGLSDGIRSLYEAEARFLRALSYYNLYSWFGPVPLRTSTTQELQLARATDAEMLSFIETEMLATIPFLPDPGAEQQYGRMTKGGARGMLTKFYLNTKQWQKCADMAQEVIEMNVYGLYPDYVEMFKVENERNIEFILAYPQVPGPEGIGNNVINGAFPPGFAHHPRTGLTMQSNWNNWAAQYRLYDSFYNSFDEKDSRKDLIITEYINSAGELVSLLNNNNTRPFKYWPDPNANANQHGNDIPEVRYADILLSKAEALNNLVGPNDESIDLINLVRERAKLQGYSLDSFSSTEALNEAILDERGWEFYAERKRRQDLIRMGRFISSAHERGISNARDIHVVFPIPQVAMDSDPLLVQNDGY